LGSFFSFEGILGSSSSDFSPSADGFFFATVAPGCLRGPSCWAVTIPATTSNVAAQGRKILKDIALSGRSSRETITKDGDAGWPVAENFTVGPGTLPLTVAAKRAKRANTSTGAATVRERCFARAQFTHGPRPPPCFFMYTWNLRFARSSFHWRYAPWKSGSRTRIRGKRDRR